MGSEQPLVVFPLDCQQDAKGNNNAEKQDADRTQHHRCALSQQGHQPAEKQRQGNAEDAF